MINRPFRCRAALREIVIPALTICFLFSLMGCGRDSSEQRADPLSSQSNLSRVAQKLLAAGVADEAAVELAKQIELAVKDAASTRQFLSELNLQDASVDRVAAECLLERALRDESDSVAVAALEMMVEQSPQNTRWLAMLWQGNMEIGRTWEASQSADRLSRQGAATAAQLLSLIRRSEVFPVEESSPKPSGFEAWVPLKRARWFVSREQYAEAEAALRPLWISQFADPAAAALYLRVLAELQRTDQFCQLHADWHAELLDRADYWCAAGQFLLDQSEYQAAAGALLRAVNIDPTMRIAYQRLSRCMKSLGRNDDAEQFRHLGLQVAASETIARRIDEQPDNLAAKSDLAQLLLELNRPFEALEWTRLTIPESDAPRRALLARRRYQLASSPGVEQAASEMALMGLAIKDFPCRQRLVALTSSLRNATTAAVDSQPSPPFAVPRLENVGRRQNADFQWYHDSTIDLETIPLYESVGGGMAAIDFDLDGWPDLYFAQGGGKPPAESASLSSELRRNLNGHFFEVTEHAGAQDFHYSSGIAAGDVNQDGFPDLFMGALGKNRLLINNGDGTFRDATDSLGRLADRFTTSVAIADVNGDAIADLFEVNYIEMQGAFVEPARNADGVYELPSPLLFLPAADRLFLNDGQGRFELVDIEADIAQPATGLGIVITDFDGVAGNEVFVGNDLRENHYLRFVDGAFRNAAPVSGVASGLHGLANGCMGIATGDFDRSGTLDLHIGNYREESDNLYLQNKNGSFRDRSTAFGLREVTLNSVTFGAKALDFDRNGWLDLIVTNGHIFDMRFMNQGYKMSPNLMMSDGSKFSPVRVEDASGYWSGSYLGRTIVMTDFNRDGNTDFVIGHLEAPTALLENRTVTQRNHVVLELVGTASERDATGAKVSVTVAGRRVVQWMTAGDGYFCSDERYLDLATGGEPQIDTIEVAWPSGQTSEFHNVQPNHRYLVIENQEDLFTCH